MLRSMTGFGRASDSGWVVEIKSLNRRHLEISMNGQAPEMEVRAWVQKRVARGRVTVNVAAEEGVVRPNLLLLQGLKRAADEMAATLGLEQTFCFELLAKGAPLTEVPEAGELRPVVEAALRQLVAARDAEGVALARDLGPRLERMATLLGEIEGRAGAAGERIKERVGETLPEAEVALLIERSDFSEEVVRFGHHLVTLRGEVDSDERASGRKLDFLLQELLREVNTIGAKAQDVEVSERVIEIKAELERVREQIQNVE
jgi:uncharacterized protein YicC (UPF0701 family)